MCWATSLFGRSVREGGNIEKKVYGYIRVSTREQNDGRQRIALTEAGLCQKQLFIDRQSGKDFNRPEYIKLMQKLRAGDILYIKSIDRLGRNYREIQEQWRILTKEKGVDICVLDMPLLDTRKDKDLTGTLIADIVLQLLSYVAETERDMIRQRQAEGIAAAKARGIHWGRPKRVLDAAFYEALKAWKSGQMTCKRAAESCGMSLSNFRYHATKNG